MSDNRYIVLMGEGGHLRPAQWLDGSDGRNERGFYFGTHATSFRSLDIARRRVRWSRERDEERFRAYRHGVGTRWRYEIRRIKREEDQ